MKWLAYILMLFPGPVKAPVPVERSCVREYVVDIIECNEVCNQEQPHQTRLKQHVYWKWDTVQCRETGRDMKALVNRGWRTITDSGTMDGITVEQNQWVDTFTRGDSLYRIKATSIYFTRFPVDIEVENRHHYRPIVP